MDNCKFEGCKKEKIKARGLCSSHYDIFKKGSKCSGVYGIYLNFSNETYFYIGSTFLQEIKTEVNKHKWEMKNYSNEKVSGKKLVRYFAKLCNEHSSLSTDEVWDKYVEIKELETFNMVAGTLYSKTDSEDYTEVEDKSDMQKWFLKHYRHIFKNIKLNEGVQNDGHLTTDEREIAQYIWYQYKLISNKETYFINNHIQTYGEQYCLNERKVKI